jgi:hypothetical protein
LHDRAIVHESSVIAQECGIRCVVAEMLGDLGVGIPLVGAMIMLVPYRGVGSVVDEGPGLVCDTHDCGSSI